MSSSVEQLTCRLAGVGQSDRDHALVEFSADMFRVMVSGRSLRIAPQRPVARVEKVLRFLIDELLGTGRPELVPFEASRRRAATVPGATLRVQAARGDGRTDVYVYSPDLAYRYRFDRRFDLRLPGRAAWIMANPGTGDTKEGPRPTLANAISISRAHGCGAITVVNLAARRSARLADLPGDADLIGPGNQAFVMEAVAGADLVVAAWGSAADTSPLDTAARALRRALAEDGIAVLAPADADGRPKLTARGHPAHPLRLGGSAPLALWNPEGLEPRQPVRRPRAISRTPIQTDQHAVGSVPRELAPPREPDTRLAALMEDRLRPALAAAGARPDYCEAFMQAVGDQIDGQQYAHAALALASLLRGDVSVLVDGGGTQLPLDEVIRNLVDARVDAVKAARALVLGAVAVGGCPDRIRPAWQHCQDYGNVTRGGRESDHPVKGVNSPSGARALYNILIGRRGAPGTMATQARGPVEHR